MANLPDEAIQIILEMAAEEPWSGPATWEDALAEGNLRIYRFLDWQSQRVFWTLNRTALRAARFAFLVGLEVRHPLHAYYWS